MTDADLNPKGFAADSRIRDNLGRLSGAMTTLERERGRKFEVTSGLRSWDDHVRIYKEINSRRGTPLAIPTHSNHLSGLAVDVSDPSKAVWTWAMANLLLLERLGLYLELRRGPWVHFQLKAPRSGNRIFIP